jgi:hypothetical protein
MIALPRRILERRDDVPGFEQRVILKNLFAAGTGGQQIQNVANADMQPAQAWAPAIGRGRR